MCGSQATILSTLGVLVTAGLTGVFCYFYVTFSYVEELLIGAVLSSTDLFDKRVFF